MYDRAVCQMVKETVEPIMDQYKPPGLVKSIYFKTLTFGEAPIRLNDVWVEDEGDNHVLLEVCAFPCDGAFARLVSAATFPLCECAC